MPGIVGIIGALPSSLARAQLVEMVGRPDNASAQTGVRVEAGSNVGIGWTHRADSFAGKFPVQNESGDIVLILAGEVLPDASRSQYTITPEELLQEYETSGPGFVRSLNGWFSGVVIDRRRGTSYLFTDRYGMERLFFHNGRNAFYFASEAKALLRVLPECREFDVHAVAEFITTGCTLGEQSLYKNVRILPGGAWWTFTRGELATSTRYFESSEWESTEELEEPQFRRAYVERFQNVVQKYTHGGQIGVSLTGGLDSRMLMSALAAPQGSVPCYTFGSMYRDTFDVKVSRAVAGALRQPYSVIVLGPEYVSQIEKYFERAVFVSDGYMGFGGAAELYANEKASCIARIRVTGNYGSELLRGVRAFKFQPALGATLSGDVKPFITQAGTKFAQLSALPPTTFGAFVQAPHQDFGRMAIERSQLTPRTPFMSNDMVALVYAAPLGFDGFALAEEVIAAGRLELMRIPTDRGYLGSGGKMIRKLRHFHRQALFKAEYWANSGMPNWLMRRKRFRASVRLEDRLLGWHKFDHVRVWMRQMRPYIHDVLLKDRASDISPYVDRVRLTSMLRDHFEERANHSVEIDRLTTIALTKRLLIARLEPATMDRTLRHGQQHCGVKL